ncbi:uncharacterized protein LOC135483870 isoform X2 [Lineus longissimus]|uniref:uncharacterized protein LOC135483870 isoform X2 n=1 Tax=Lineus longissimus TaxID=88925 RepID=UPI002B4D3F56
MENHERCQNSSETEPVSVDCRNVSTKQNISFRRRMGDFSNIVKAFIGSNYLGLPFGFFQSGLLLGCISLVIIVAVTDHCCQLIVKCKKYLVEELCEKYERENSEEDDGTYRQHLQRDLRYADIGGLCFGKWGIVIVDVFLLITQTGFCVAYFIFVGNTLLAMFPLKEVTVQLVYPWQNVTVNHTRTDHFSFDSEGHPIHGYNNIESFLGKNDLDHDMVEFVNKEDLGPSATPYFMVFGAGNATTITTTVPGNHTSDTTIGPSTSGNQTTATPITTPFMNTTTILPTNESLIPATNTSDHVFVSSAPDLRWLVIAPLLPFILFAYIRNIRKLGPISLIANVAIFGGYFAILIYMLIDIKIDPGVVYFKWETFPVFFGQVSVAFEGIGLILPVEASMEGNRKNFPFYLHGALFLVSCVLSSFGIIGYLRYGPHVQQVIVNNLPPFSVLSLCVDTCLILAIACTYPLQVFPVCQITEHYIFRLGSAHDTSQLSGLVQDKDEEDEVEFDNDGSTEATALIVVQRQKEVPTWKRNILRTIVVLVIGGLSVLLRNNFAYISAFVGSCGSTALAYVLPCLFHIKIKGRELHPVIIAKNVIIIIFGVVGGITGVVVTVQQIIHNL